MRVLFDLFVDICLFRRGPQDVPMSQALLKLTLTVYALASLCLILVTVTLGLGVVLVLLDVALLAALTYGVLNATGYGERFMQTLTALTGVGALLGLVALPLELWLIQETGEAALLPQLLYLGLLIWNIAVMAHILKNALSTTRAMAVLYALGYFIISMIVFAPLISREG